jgi:hypothetical protein
MVAQGAAPVASACLFTRTYAAVFQTCPVDVLMALRMNSPVGQLFPFGTDKLVILFVEGEGGERINAFVVLAPVVLDRHMGIDPLSDEGVEEGTGTVALFGAYCGGIDAEGPRMSRKLGKCILSLRGQIGSPGPEDDARSVLDYVSSRMGKLRTAAGRLSGKAGIGISRRTSAADVCFDKENATVYPFRTLTITTSKIAQSEEQHRRGFQEGVDARSHLRALF